MFGLPGHFVAQASAKVMGAASDFRQLVRSRFVFGFRLVISSCLSPCGGGTRKLRLGFDQRCS